MYLPRDLRFARSTSAEVDQLFQGVKVLQQGVQDAGPEYEIAGSLRNLKP